MIDKRRHFTFGSVNSADYHCYIFDDEVYGGSPRQYTLIDVPGRSGSLVIDDKRYKNLEHSLACVITENFAKNFSALRNALLSQVGYQKLIDSDFHDEFYMALINEDLAINQVSQNRMMGSFTVTFNRKPQRYLMQDVDGITLTASGTITNPTVCESKPLFKVYGSGDISLGVATSTIEIQDVDEYVEIDCETMEAYKDTESWNSKVTFQGGYPVLHEGDNGITMEGADSLVIYPRWWRL